jgi:hypothetical protein
MRRHHAATSPPRSAALTTVPTATPTTVPTATPTTVPTATPTTVPTTALAAVPMAALAAAPMAALTAVLTAALTAVLAAVLVAVSIAAGPAGPAQAHPFGPPSTARISADGPRVDLVWRAAEDDWVALGQSLGAFEDPALGPVATELTGEQKLERSPAVRDYLTGRIAVSQADRLCPATLLPLTDLAARGARFEFACPAPVTEIEVRLAALTDMHTAYRTVLSAEPGMDPAQVLFTADRPQQRVSLTGGGPSPVAGLAAGTGAVVAAGLVVVLLRRHRRTRRAREGAR